MKKLATKKAAFSDSLYSIYINHLLVTRILYKNTWLYIELTLW